MQPTSVAHFENIRETILALLRCARTSVKVCVAWIDGATYSKVFAELAQRGVRVEVIYHSDMLNASNPITSAYGVFCYGLKPRLQKAIMHNKFCIIDNEVLINGSYNWSRSAAQHFENIVVTTGDYPLVLAFLHEFEDLKAFVERGGKVIEPCPRSRCKSHSYQLGILGGETGHHAQSRITTWRVCTRHQHVVQGSEHFVHHLDASFGLTHVDQEPEDELDLLAMLSRFRIERSGIDKLQQTFRELREQGVHAIGRIGELNFSEHNEWNVPLKRGIAMLWRDIHYRKIVPKLIHEHEGETGVIIAHDQ
jgi:hypothetical protein